MYLFKYLFMIFIYLFIYYLFIIYLFIYLFVCFFNYLFIRKLYLLEVMLLDWITKLKRSIFYVLLQIVYFQKVLNVSNMEYLMYPSMFRQFNVYNINWHSWFVDIYKQAADFHVTYWFSCDFARKYALIDPFCELAANLFFQIL